MNDQIEKMATIWKYPLAPVDVLVHDIPKGAKPLNIGPDAEDRLSIWFIVDPTQPMEKRSIIMVGTGHKVPMGAAKDYVGTFVVGDGVNHIFVPPAPAI